MVRLITVKISKPTYTPPFYHRPAFWDLLDNIDVSIIVLKPRALGVIGHIRPSIVGLIFFITKLLK